MCKTEPIRDRNQIDELKKYFIKKSEYRNYVMIVFGMNTSLRISDMLNLRWSDVYNFRTNTYRKHLNLIEQKTHKNTVIAINSAVVDALNMYKSTLEIIEPDLFLFKSRNGDNRPISRNRAFNIIKDAANDLELESNIACHSLRKTFGYQAWKKGVTPVLLMSIYNHSSYEITKRYLGITQDERDEVFLGIQL